MKKTEQVYYIPPLVFPHPSTYKNAPPSETESELGKALAAAVKKCGSSPFFLTGAVIFTVLEAAIIASALVRPSPLSAAGIPYLPFCAALWVIFADCRKKDGFRTAGFFLMNIFFMMLTVFLTLASFGAVAALSAVTFLSILGGGFNALNIIALTTASSALVFALIHAVTAVSVISEITNAVKKGAMPRKITMFMPVMSAAVSAMVSSAFAFFGVMYYRYPVFAAVSAAVLNIAGTVAVLEPYIRFKNEIKNF